MKDELVGLVELSALLLWKGALMKFMGVIRAWAAAESGLLSDLMVIWCSDVYY